jgi:hypothetical protein
MSMRSEIDRQTPGFAEFLRSPEFVERCRSLKVNQYEVVLSCGRDLVDRDISVTYVITGEGLRVRRVDNAPTVCNYPDEDEAVPIHDPEQVRRAVSASLIEEFSRYRRSANFLEEVRIELQRVAKLARRPDRV